MYEIRDCRLADLRAIASNLRSEDRLELLLHHPKPLRILYNLHQSSGARKAALVDGEVVAVWGFVTPPLLASEVEAWLFTSPGIERAKLAFFRETRREVESLRAMGYDVVSDTLATHLDSIRFFDQLGFSLGAPFRFSGQWLRPMRLGRERWTAPRTRASAPPYVICALGRSRTAWCSSFLSYREWTCYHEALLYLDSPEDCAQFLQRKCTGTAETAAAPGWQLIRHFRPDTRLVVIRRDVQDATDAMAASYDKIGRPYDPAKLRAVFEREARDLDKIAKQPDTLAIAFEDLENESTCRQLFEFCLPFSFDRAWWKKWARKNVQADLGDVLSEYAPRRNKVEGLKKTMRRALVRAARAGAV